LAKNFVVLQERQRGLVCLIHYIKEKKICQDAIWSVSEPNLLTEINSKDNIYPPALMKKALNDENKNSRLGEGELLYVLLLTLYVLLSSP
jgi:hypothetical protein